MGCLKRVSQKASCTRTRSSTLLFQSRTLAASFAVVDEVILVRVLGALLGAELGVLAVLVEQMSLGTGNMTVGGGFDRFHVISKCHPL
jgi:hypothetical protein